MGVKIDLMRLDALIKGEMPTTAAEEYFVLAYTAGLQGDLLLQTQLGIVDQLDYITLNDFHYFVLGYAMGQRDLNDVEEEMIETGHNKTTH